MESKKWYQSKLVWLGILQTLIGSLGLVAELLQKAVIQPFDLVFLFSGILTIVIRVFFTNQPIAS